MWFDDDLMGSRRYSLTGSRKSSRRRPILVLNTRLRRSRREWVLRAGTVLLAFSGIALIAGMGHFALRSVTRWLFLENDEYLLTNLVVRCENPVLTEYITEQMSLSTGTNLFRINIDAIQRGAESTANIRSAAVCRRLPGTLEVWLSERVPVARLGNPRDYQRYLVVDEEGIVFLARSRSKAKSLPSITGYGNRRLVPGDKIDQNISDALALLSVCRTTTAGRTLRVSSIDIEPNCLMAKLAEGPVVSLGWKRGGDGDRNGQVGDLEARLDYLCTILWRRRQEGKPVDSVDLTFDDYRRYTTIKPL